MKEITAWRKYKDPSFLTPYEEEIYSYINKGMGPKEISEAMGGKSTAASVLSRIKVIEEKVELRKVIEAQDNRLYWP